MRGCRLHGKQTARRASLRGCSEFGAVWRFFELFDFFDFFELFDSFSHQNSGAPAPTSTQASPVPSGRGWGGDSLGATGTLQKPHNLPQNPCHDSSPRSTPPGSAGRSVDDVRSLNSSTSSNSLISSICLESAHRSLPCTLSKGAASFFELFELFDPFEFFDPFNFFELPHFYSPITPLDALGARGAPSNWRAIRAPRDRIHHTSVSLPDNRGQTFLMTVQRLNFSPFHPAPALVLQPRTATSEIANHSKTPSSTLLQPHSAQPIPAIPAKPQHDRRPRTGAQQDPGSGVPTSKIGLSIPIDAQL